ncbi:NHLP leader peptide family RiPP precursor [Pedobacter alluvionis]|uniref:NHLP leader peptide family natural product n=1 Tax=Pedobacter alluvionis TaxID=475253 RepID=A0A497XL15_9SPHI|nr:NHLP leader peptide family RiPP precursor [Pedobacter alluvionis]RLJ69193.1 putative ribosomally synthesized peptide [Pedobacter alluvionis]TFB29741.1 NHLP leader peptide family natural product precursor [Pedobacter alluvionis]
MDSLDRASAEAQIIKKAMKDSTFRASLIADPKSAIEQTLGITLPANVSVNVYEDTATSFNMVLPAASGSEQMGSDIGSAADCSGWSSAAECAAECTQCGNNDTTCQPGPTEE